MTDTMVPNGGHALTGHASGAQALSSGGSFDDTAIAYANVTSASLSPASDVLTLYSGGGSTSLQLSGNLQGASVGLSSDGAGGTEIVDMGVAPQATDPLSTSAGLTQTVILAGGNLQFVNTLSNTVGQGYENAIVTAEAFYQSQIANTATMSFTFELASGAGPGTNSYSAVNVTFSQLQTALGNAATSADDRAAVAQIAAEASHYSGLTFQIADPLAVVLGLPGASAGSDITQLDPALTYFYNQSSPTTNGLDAVSILEHEISEGGFGRIGGDGTVNGVMDLFRYAAAGTPDITLGADGRPTFFSIDGTHLLTEFHNPLGGGGGNDSADWDSSGTGQQPTYLQGTNTYDSYGATTTGAVGMVTNTDLRALDVIGWTLSATAPLTVVSSGQTATVNPGQVDSGVTVQSGGVLNVDSGGVAQAAVVSGGIEVIFSGGLDTGATLLAGGEQVVSGGASASGVTVQSGGFQLVRSGGYSSGTTVLSGGLERFYSGASATNLVLSSGAILGTELVVPGGTSASVTSTTASGATVVSGVTVMSGGIIETQAGTVLNGGFLAFGAGTVLPGLTTVSSGGTLSGPGTMMGDVVDYGLMDGGVVIGSSASDKAYLFLEAGGAISGVTVGDNGDLVINAGGVIDSVTLRPGASVDLVNISATAASVNASNQLVVTSGGVTVETIAGVMAPGLLFSASGDGSGGTTLTAMGAVSDYNADGLSDLSWRNSNGDAGIWLTGPGGGYTAVEFGVVDTNWAIQSVGDFNGDGKADLLWRNTATGQVGEWLSRPGAGYTGFTMPILATVDLSWAVQGVGDFNGDGLTDILWRNTNGDAGIWLTNAGGSFTPIDFGVFGNDWTIQGVGDFNGDGKADILWRNSNGNVGEWLSKPGAGYAGFTTPIIANVDPSWRIQGVGDFSGDGLGDILWRNLNGDTGIWVTTAGGGFTAIDFGVVDSSWTIQGVGDFNGDGKADILWRQSSGDVGEWLSKPGPGYTGFTYQILADVATSWRLQGIPPALQGGIVTTAPLAQAMAAMGGQGAGVSTAHAEGASAAAVPRLVDPEAVRHAGLGAAPRDFRAS